MKDLLLFCLVVCLCLLPGSSFTTPLPRVCRTSRGTLSMSQRTYGAPSDAPRVPRVAFQGEPGAYSEKSLREFLGPLVIALPQKSFEAAFKAVSSGEADYALMPIENSLGGSIHSCYDLLLRYELYIVGEHEFRVEHTLMALPGTKLSEVTKAMSHPQALAQCDGYLRSRGIEPDPKYDTAGSAKMIAEGKLEGVAAIASDLAAKTYGLEVLESNIEDDDVNFTRFQLLSRESAAVHLKPSVPSKTSIVFTLPNTAGALYKALACFSLRDIDFSKIESRPTSAQLLQYLRFQEMTQATEGRRKFGQGTKKETDITRNDLPRFQYCFYLDFLASELDGNAQAALSHLKEVSPFLRVLGSYPCSGNIFTPLKLVLDKLDSSSGKAILGGRPEVGPTLLEADLAEEMLPLKIGIVGFGNFGQFLAKTFAKHSQVFVTGRTDQTKLARELGCKYYSPYEQAEMFANDLDVVLFSVSILSFEEVLRAIPSHYLRNKLVVDVLSVKMHPKQVMQELLPHDADVLCTHPMFGPESGGVSWQGLPFLYDKVRIRNPTRLNRFLEIWESQRCKMVEMSSELHDEYAANTQFITHLMGRMLEEQGLASTPIDTRGFTNLLKLTESTCSDSFDLFYGLYHFNANSHETLRRLRESLSQVERQLAAKEAYIAAKSEMAASERQRILTEVRELMKDAIKQGIVNVPGDGQATPALASSTNEALNINDNDKQAELEGQAPDAVAAELVK
ncbi:unnamed protein product [Chrysoparadoxa australica]